MPGGGWGVSYFLLPPKPDEPLKKYLQDRDSAGSSGQAPEVWFGWSYCNGWVSGNKLLGEDFERCELLRRAHYPRSCSPAAELHGDIAGLHIRFVFVEILPSARSQRAAPERRRRRRAIITTAVHPGVFWSCLETSSEADHTPKFESSRFFKPFLCWAVEGDETD